MTFDVYEHILLANSNEENIKLLDSKACWFGCYTQSGDVK